MVQFKASDYIQLWPSPTTYHLPILYASTVCQIWSLVPLSMVDWFTMTENNPASIQCTHYHIHDMNALSVLSLVLIRSALFILSVES